jgi:hypothetical protein
MLHPAFLRDTSQAARSGGGVIEPAARLAVTLRLLARASYLDLAMQFRIARPTVYESFHFAIDIICKRLAMPGIPIGDMESLRDLADDLTLSRTPESPLCGCIGASAGIAISILKPPDEFVPRNFYCRKGMYALPIQAIVDSSYKFIYMSANGFGSTHDFLSFACSRPRRQVTEFQFAAIILARRRWRKWRC